MDKFLVIGLGSMGKRRIRCLLSLGVKAENIYGIDIREDRRKEAHNKYGIFDIETLSMIDFKDIKAVIVSLPPDKHYEGVKIAIDNKKPVFVEASVVLKDVQKIKEYNNNSVFVAPSCTMVYHPIIKEIKKIIDEKKLGKVCNFSYHSGQYLPDWHPWENVNDFYVSNMETGGAREIVPFELTWITKVLGMPENIKGYYRKTAQIGCDIDDSYVCVLDYNDMLGTMIVDVVARYATRSLIINFQEGQVLWDCNRKKLDIYSAKTCDWSSVAHDNIKNETGYIDTIDENMYIEEIDSFLKGIDNYKDYNNTIDEDIKILELLEILEKSDSHHS